MAQMKEYRKAAEVGQHESEWYPEMELFDQQTRGLP